MDWHNAYEKILPYVVRIDSDDGFGTGYLFAYNKNHNVAVIATAAHVIDKAYEWRKPLKLFHYGSKKEIFLKYAERAIWIDRKRDAASVLIDVGSLDFPQDALPLIEVDKYQKIGVEVGWVGFPVLAPSNLCFFSGKVSHFVEEEDSYFIDGVAINGVSGGPVFKYNPDESLQVIGIVSAYMPNRRIGDTLPGLLFAHDVTSFHEHLKKINDLDEAKEQEKAAQKTDEKQAEQGGKK